MTTPKKLVVGKGPEAARKNHPDLGRPRSSLRDVRTKNLTHEYSPPTHRFDHWTIDPPSIDPSPAAEREADQMAEQVVSGGRGSGPVNAVPGGVLQRRSASVSRPAQPVATPRSEGQPLGEADRGFFEARLGHDLRRVRIHREPEAQQAAGALGARAFTVGERIAFGAGQYAPATHEGRKLLAHELTHVLQQRKSGRIALQRKPDPYVYPNPKSLEHAEIGKSFTLLKPTKLKSKGPFSAEVLRSISSIFTENAAWYDPQSAHWILAALESSPTFLRLAATLDKYYAKRAKKLDFWIRFRGPGSRFLPKGGRAGQGFERDNDILQIDQDVVTFGQGRTAKSARYQAMAYLRILVHETAHAYRHVRGLHGSGLRNQLRDEQGTRKLESKMLAEVAKGLKDQGLQTELAAQRKLVGSQDLKKIAHNLVSGTKLTYLEHFFVGSALDRFHQQYLGLKNTKPIDGLIDPRKADSLDVGAFRQQLATHVQALRGILTRHGDRPKPKTPATKSSTKSSTKSPTKSPTKSAPPAKPGEPRLTTPRSASVPTTGTATPPAPLAQPRLSIAATKLCEEVLSKTWTLKQITDTLPRRGKKLAPAEQAVYSYVLLVKVLEVKQGIYQARENFGTKREGPEYRAFVDRIAKDFLGRPKVYRAY